MFVVEIEVSCEQCGRLERIPAGQWKTNCSNLSCQKNGSDDILAPVAQGKKYIEIKCKKMLIDCVDDYEFLTNCKCCEEEPKEYAIDYMVLQIKNDQKVYGTTEATAFIRRRCKEMNETGEKLHVVVTEMEKMGVKLSDVKTKERKVDVDDCLADSCTINCDYCGAKIFILPGKLGAKCKNEGCITNSTRNNDTNMLRPLSEFKKYVCIACPKEGGKSVGYGVLKTADFIECRCCKTEYAIDSVVEKVVSNQPIYSTVLTNGFIKRQVTELRKMRRQLEMASEALDKQIKNKTGKPSLCDRVLLKTKEIVKGKKK